MDNYKDTAKAILEQYTHKRSTFFTQAICHIIVASGGIQPSWFLPKEERDKHNKRFLQDLQNNMFPEGKMIYTSS